MSAPEAEHRLGEVRVTLRRVATADVVPLRHRVLRPGLPPETAVFDGDDEPETRHFAAFLEHRVDAIACLSFMRRPLDGQAAYQLRGMAVRVDLARRGLGRALLAFAARALHAEVGDVLLWCNARTTAAPFYERLGWTIVSPPFDIPGVGPHVRMVRSAHERGGG